jgi:hypothetical protein
MPLARQRLTLTLDKEETAMLRQLMAASGKKKPEIVRELIRGAYKKLVPKLKAGAGFGVTGMLLATPVTPSTTSRKKSASKKR